MSPAATIHLRPSVGVPMPSNAPLQTGPPAMPAGITDVTQWGRTSITFGKFKGKRNYLSLFNSTDPDDKQHKSWLVSHYANGSAQLRDLVEYLKEKGDDATISMTTGQTVVIPGTTIVRRFTP